MRIGILVYYGILNSTRTLFATTEVIMKQEAVEAMIMKYLPTKLPLEALAILPAARKIKHASVTVKIFRPMNAMMFVWVSVANRGLTSIAPLPVTPTTVVSKSATPRRSRAEQITVCILTMKSTLSCLVTP